MTEERKEGSEVLRELEALGQQLTTAVKTLWESEDSRKLRQELREGFTELGQQVDRAVKSAQESEAAREFGGQVKETVDKARESDLVGKLEQGILSGLRELNQELSEFVSSKEVEETGEDVPESDAAA